MSGVYLGRTKAYLGLSGYYLGSLGLVWGFCLGTIWGRFGAIWGRSGFILCRSGPVATELDCIVFAGETVQAQPPTAESPTMKLQITFQPAGEFSTRPSWDFDTITRPWDVFFSPSSIPMATTSIPTGAELD